MKKKPRILDKEILYNSQENIEIPSQNKQSEISFLLEGPELKVKNKFTDYRFDRENEIIELRNGRKITLAEIRAFIANVPNSYNITFPEKFYKEIYRLNNWKWSKKSKKEKPLIIGLWTKILIYGRFPKEVIQTLEQVNPYIELGVRMFKHYQWLNLDSKNKLDNYIDQAIELMKNSTDWYHFRIQYARTYGIAFQISMFEDIYS